MTTPPWRERLFQRSRIGPLIRGIDKEMEHGAVVPEVVGFFRAPARHVGLYAFARARGARVLCLAHVTNTMGQADEDFEKGEAEGSVDALALLDALARSWTPVAGRDGLTPRPGAP